MKNLVSFLNDTVAESKRGKGVGGGHEGAMEESLYVRKREITINNRSYYGEISARGRSGFRPFWRTLMVQTRPHY